MPALTLAWCAILLGKQKNVFDLIFWASFRNTIIFICLVPPKLVEQPTALEPSGQPVAKKVQIVVEQTGELTCPVEGGNPPPTVQWLLNGQPLKLASDGESSVEVAGITHTYNPTKDLGKLLLGGTGNGEFHYSCVVTNKAGSVQKDFTVEVSFIMLMIPN